MNSESGHSQVQPSSVSPAIVPPVPPPAAAKPQALLGPIGGVFLLFFGVVLPAVTVVIELASGWCSRTSRRVSRRRVHKWRFRPARWCLV